MTLETPAQGEGWERLFRHGGDLAAARRAFPQAPEPWIDLSTGINPVSYPLPALPQDLWARLPHPAELDALLKAAGARYGRPASWVVAGPGTQALVQMLSRLFPAEDVAILGPTYSGHETAWRAAGAAVRIVSSAQALAGAQRAVVVNPNNPDGRRLGREVLTELAQALASRGGLLIVDEAFADFDDHDLGRDPPPATIVLKSFGKTYGLAGLRLGFALAEPSFAARLRESLGSWPVSGPALAIAGRALADSDWLSATRERLDADVRWLDGRLLDAGFEIVGGTRLFRLARRADAARAFERLCLRGVLCRPFEARDDWLRFGLPRAEDRARVAAALAATRTGPVN